MNEKPGSSIKDRGWFGGCRQRGRTNFFHTSDTTHIDNVRENESIKIKGNEIWVENMGKNYILTRLPLI